MMLRWSLILIAGFSFAIPLTAQAKKPERTFHIPYRLTKSQHLLVRVKINDKGPFHFILDTGAPIVILSKEAAKKLKLKIDDKGWTTFDRFAVEGGLTKKKVKSLITTPYQLTGMNSLGLAGAELHGIIGYTFLAQYRMQFDLADRKLTWTELADFRPPPPMAIRPKGGKNPTAGMDLMAGLVKFLSAMIGTKAQPERVPRGFLGIQTKRIDGRTFVAQALPGSPADKAGLREGDRLLQINGKDIGNMADLHEQTAKVTAGQSIRFTIGRGTSTKQITIKAGSGL